MIDKKALTQIKDHLFIKEEQHIYAVVDGAACPELRFKIFDWEPQSACLWSGDLEPDMEEVAPYMIKLEKESEMTDWLITEGWGNNWNIFTASKLDPREFRKQIRKLLLVKSPEGKNLIFRFYDPRVIDIFLPTSKGEQAQELFNGLESIFYPSQQEDGLVRAQLSSESNEIELELLA